MISHSKAASEKLAQGKDETLSESTVHSPDAEAVTDEDLRRRVRLFLIGSNLPGLRHIEPEVHGDTVILKGSVRTFYEKQLAVRLSRRVAGVIHIVDSIEASGYPPRSEPARSSHRPAAPLSPRRQ